MIRRRYFHRTKPEVAASILAGGFEDGVGHYLASGPLHRGVWLSNVPLDCDEGAHGAMLLTVKIAPRYLKRYEWVEEGKPYREFLVPARIINRHGRIRRVSAAEEERMTRRQMRQAPRRAPARGVPVTELLE